MHGVARPAAEQRVIAVLAVACGALGAALQPAVDACVAVVPAARPLQQVASDGGEVADLRAGRRGRRLRERAVALADHRVLLDLRKGGERADLESPGARLDAA